MCCYVFLVMAYRTLEPMICVIVLLLVAVRYSSYIAAGIAGCVTSVVKDMSCDVFLFAA